MILLAIVLFLAAFIQSTLVPINLVLLILMARSFETTDKANYFLAFFFGTLFSLLSGFPLGSLSLAYLVMVAFIYFIKKVEFSSHWLILLPLSLALFSADCFLQGFLMGSSFNLRIVFGEIMLILPVFLLVKFWEERFIPETNVKLKLGK
jgi:cell shape-determining protein MreD